MRVHHLALRVADCERSWRFYHGVLGLGEIDRQQRRGRLHSVWLRAGGAVLMLERTLKGRGPESGSGHVLVFAVPDLAAWRRRLARASVAIVDRTEHTAYVSDPDGHRVGVSDYPWTRHRRRRRIEGRTGVVRASRNRKRT